MIFPLEPTDAPHVNPTPDPVRRYLAHFEVFQGDDGLWYWRLVGANGEKEAQSEGYEGGRDSAVRGVSDAVRSVLSALKQSITDIGILPLV